MGYVSFRERTLFTHGKKLNTPRWFHEKHRCSFPLGGNSNEAESIETQGF